MKKLYFALGAAAITLGSVMSACNKEDDIKKNPNSILQEVEYSENDTLKTTTIVMSFDRFKSQSVPEVTIANEDTTILMVDKEFLNRNHEAIKDTNTYIVVWDKPTNFPFYTKVTDAEDAGDKIKVLVKRAEVSDVIPQGSYEMALNPYIDRNESVRNADGTINSNCFVEGNGTIHPVAIFLEEDQKTLQKSGEDDGVIQESNSNKWTVGLVEGIADENASIDSKIELSFKLENSKKLRKDWTFAEGSWGKIAGSVGFNELSLKAVEGIHLQLNTHETWSKTSWWPHIPYPSGIAMDNFAMAVYGDIDIKADLGLDINVLLEKDHDVPSDFVNDDYYDKEAYDEGDNFDDDDDVDDDDDDVIDPTDNKASNTKKIENGIKSVVGDSYYNISGDRDNSGTGKDKSTAQHVKLIQGKKITAASFVFMIGIVPVWVTIDWYPEVRWYYPKLTATAHFGIEGKYKTSFYGGFGYAADNSQVIGLGNGTQIKMEQGWHGYSGHQTVEKSLKLKAGLEGAISTRIGVFFVVQASLMNCVDANLAIGAYTKGTLSGQVTGWEYDILAENNATSSLNANLGACVELGFGGEVGAEINAFGLKKFASTDLELTFFSIPLFKYLVSTQTGVAYKGTLAGVDDSQNIRVKVKDRNHQNHEFLPDDFSLYNSFLRAEKLEITLPEITVDGAKIPSTTISNVERNIDSNDGSYSGINCTTTATADNGKTVKLSIKNGYIKNEGTLVDNKYYNFKFDLVVEIDGKEYNYKFTTNSSTSKSVRVPYALD